MDEERTNGQDPDHTPQTETAIDSFKTLVVEEFVWLMQTAGQVVALIVTTRIVTWLTKSAGIDLQTILSGNWQKHVDSAVDDRSRGDDGNHNNFH